ncbi:hypothetical protein ABKA04_000788 [Annulohypoxylon sp. FPYF3050]
MGDFAKSLANPPEGTPPQPQFIEVERGHLEDLTRRANMLGSMVCITKSEYEGFLQIQTQYATLVSNLIATGVSPAHVWALAETPQPPQSHQTIHTPLQESKPTGQAKPVEASKIYKPYMVQKSDESDESEKPNKSEKPEMSNKLEKPDKPDRSERPVASRAMFTATRLQATTHLGNGGSSRMLTRQPFQPPHSKRTIILENIPVDATCWDVTSAIRGGVLVDFAIKEKEDKRLAIVSFLSPDSAANFFEQSKKRGLYVNNTMVSLKWSEKQHVVSQYISNKANIGATRNMVVKGCAPYLTRENIRQDLEHIEGLIVIKLDFDPNGDCHIKTNSIQLAIYARTCMKSRKAYKGFSMYWDADECGECDQSPTTAKEDMLSKNWRGQPSNNGTTVAKSPIRKTSNRFASLAIEGNDDGN